MDYRIVPHAVFTDPQLAGVGRTEGEARESRIRVQSVSVPLRLVVKAELTKDTRGAIKVIIEEGSSRILGVHMLAPQASGLLHDGVKIVKENMTVEDVLDTLHIFPSLSDAFKKAAHALELERNKKKIDLCWLSLSATQLLVVASRKATTRFQRFKPVETLQLFCVLTFLMYIYGITIR